MFWYCPNRDVCIVTVVSWAYDKASSVLSSALLADKLWHLHLGAYLLFLWLLKHSLFFFRKEIKVSQKNSAGDSESAAETCDTERWCGKQ